MFRTINPATGQPLAEYQAHTNQDVESRLAAAWRAYEDWRRCAFSERAAVLSAAAIVLEQRRERYARLMTEEMGKPIMQSLGEVDKCAWVARHYADNGAHYLEPEVVATDARKSYVRFDPLGPVLAIMPWNFPFWQVFRATCPALMAGNVLLLKHASNVPGCALAIEEIWRDAGLPEGGFSTLLARSEAIGAVIEDDRVRAVTLTGSDGAGEQVGATAGSRLKKTVLELGGSDPFIVLADADIAAAAKIGAQARLVNNGQSCIAAKRFIVVEDVAREFTEEFVQRMAAAKVGDPLDPATELGPLAREDLLETLDAQVQETVRRGATLCTGGERLRRDGFFYPATVLADVQPGWPAAEEETFGPAAAVLTVADEHEAIAVANESRFGLGASLWTRDLDRGQRIAAQIEAGCVFVNGLVKSDPRLPFGGIKRSGYGRELGREGIREFVNIKTVVVS